MNKMKRNEKKERGGKGERRENIEERSQHFSVGWWKGEGEGKEEKRIERNAVRSVIRPVASGERKNIEIDEIGGEVGLPSLPSSPYYELAKVYRESKVFFFLLSLYLIRESRNER